MRVTDLRKGSTARAGALLAALWLSSGPPAMAHHVGESLALDQQVLGATNQFLGALSQWQKLPPSLKDANLAGLVQLAQSRQQLLVSLVKSDPAVAAARLLPRSVRARIPAAAAAYVETEVRAQGTGAVHVADDFARGTSVSTFKLLEADNRAPRAVYLSEPDRGKRALDPYAGKSLSLDGMQIGEVVLVLQKKHIAAQQSVQAAGGTSTGTAAATSGAATVVQGNQRTLSILLNFSDRALSCTPADVANRLFGNSGSTVNNIYRDSSRGLVSFSGDAVGPFTIGYASSGSCDYLGWGSAAEAAVRAAGIDPSQYARVNYVTPINPNCGWTGLAYMPGRQSWVQACTATGVFSHELGHNLALHHAATPTQEYGDNSDPMGGAMPVGHNGANRVMAGWQPSGTITDVSAGGSYPIATLSNSTVSSTQVLRLAKPDTGESYYVSMRQAMAYDAVLEWSFLNTLSVHRASGSLPTRTYLVQVLQPGQSFTDATNGITISHQGVSGSVATVGVGMTAATCSRQAPTVTMSPGSQSTLAGGALAYAVAVRNNNSAACGASSFNLSQALPAGFSGSFSAAAITVAPGSTGSATWNVGTAATATAGTFAIDATATDAAAPGNNATGHASVTVEAAATAPTLSITAPANGATISAGKPVPINVTVSATPVAVEIYVDATLLARDTSAPYTASWNTRKAARGGHQIRARAIDAAGRSVESSIGVTLN